MEGTLDELLSDLIEATRRAFDLCRQQAAGQTIYAYALTLCSVSGEALQTWCHTEETFAKKQARWGKPEWEGFYRYCPDEWSPIVPGRIPGKHGPDWWAELGVAVSRFYRQVRDERPDVVLDLLIDTLKALGAEGYFGTGRARGAVTLMVYLSDDDEWWRTSVRRLNPPSVVRRFRQATKPPV